MLGLQAAAREAGTAFFGGPELSGPFDGLQAEYARIPFGAVNMLELPDEVSDEQAIVLSDIFPTAYFGAELAEIKPGNTVAWERSITVAPAGVFALAASPTLSMRLPRMTMT